MKHKGHTQDVSSSGPPSELHDKICEIDILLMAMSKLHATRIRALRIDDLLPLSQALRMALIFDRPAEEIAESAKQLNSRIQALQLRLSKSRASLDVQLGLKIAANLSSELAALR